MISSVFVDRPRLAIVIAIIITHRRRHRPDAHSGVAISRHRAAAGAGQRDLPRRLGGSGRNHPSPSRSKPRSSASTETIYMKSTSGNDGSYNLTVSFELGTNPDIDTVNVNNRVQTALAQLPRDGARIRA